MRGEWEEVRTAGRGMGSARERERERLEGLWGSPAPPPLPEGENEGRGGEKLNQQSRRCAWPLQPRCGQWPRRRALVLA
jgi:hypothetical protein